MGGTVIGHLRESPDVSEIVAYDIRQERIDELRAEGVNAVSDLQMILSDPEVKLAFVTSSNETHKELCLAALEAGKAVMTEKPIATTLEDSEAIVRRAEELGAFLQVGFELRYSRLYTSVKDWIDQGLLGDVVNTTCLYVTPAFGKHSWRVGKGVTGGMFAEKLCHYVDLPRWWIGSEVEEVYTACAPNTIPYFEIRDNFHTTYKFKNGVVSHLSFMMGPSATFDGDPLQDNANDEKVRMGHYLQYTVVGTKGAAEASVYGHSLKRWEYSDAPEKMKCDLKEELGWDVKDNHEYYHNTLGQTLDIARRVSRGLPPKTPACDALETMRLTFAAELSADLGRPLKLDEIRHFGTT